MGSPDDDFFVLSILLASLVYGKPFLCGCRECKGNTFLNDLKEKRSNAQILLAYAPHCIVHHDRVKLFRQWVKEERVTEQEKPAAPVLITVQRKRIVEDGYQRISRLTAEELKGTIRVRFINAEGKYQN